MDTHIICIYIIIIVCVLFILELEELLPGIITQLGPDNLKDLKKIYQQFASSNLGKQAKAGGDDEDDVPDLVDTNFEEVSKSEKK